MSDYSNGLQNKLIKLYFYLQRGLGLLNEFKNLFLGIFAAYFALKLTSYLWLAIMFFGSLPLLIIAGYFSVHRMGKVTEWLSVKYGTHYNIRQFTLQEEQTQLLKEIKESLNTKNGGDLYEKEI